MSRNLITSVVLFVWLAVFPVVYGETPATQPAVEISERRVLIFSVDGLRPDVMLRAKAPSLRSLMADGVFSCWAQTTDVAITLPSHASMLTGMSPAKHGISWNDAQPTPAYPKVNTLFDIAHERGLSTGMAAGKTKFETFACPGSIDFAAYAPRETHNGQMSSTIWTDQTVADRAIEIIRAHQPRVMFIHLPDVDTAGHTKGWGSIAQLEAIETADSQIGRVLATLDELKLSAQTLVIVSADHGGSSTSHGRDDLRSHFIPWIARGPGVIKNHDLTLDHDLRVHTEDTFAVACDFLGLDLPADIDGKPIPQIYGRQPTTAPK
ncbi:MAG: alkaline phosphatase family protein [Phycisphaeraceae bacterium]|nr:alkaline phosphatase family protein [Phycisphaeraceae bacterium]